jgi:hypothetical protein
MPIKLEYLYSYLTAIAVNKTVPLKIGAISKQSKLPERTLYRYLRTLEDNQIIVRLNKVIYLTGNIQTNITFSGCQKEPKTEAETTESKQNITFLECQSSDKTLENLAYMLLLADKNGNIIQTPYILYILYYIGVIKGNNQKEEEVKDVSQIEKLHQTVLEYCDCNPGMINNDRVRELYSRISQANLNSTEVREVLEQGNIIFSHRYAAKNKCSRPRTVNWYKNFFDKKIEEKKYSRCGTVATDCNDIISENKPEEFKMMCEICRAPAENKRYFAGRTVVDKTLCATHSASAERKAKKMRLAYHIARLKDDSYYRNNHFNWLHMMHDYNDVIGHYPEEDFKSIKADLVAANILSCTDEAIMEFVKSLDDVKRYIPAMNDGVMMRA